MMAFVVFVLVALCIIALTTISNVLLFKRLQPEMTAKTPHVHVLVPARNEAAIISQTISALLQQTYPNYSVTLLDDHSEDGTADIAQKAAKGDARLTIIKGSDLPAGWMGKSWACHQLAQQAEGDFLLFTDSDVHWQPQGLAAVMGMMQQTEADLLSVWPTQQTVTWGERLTVPLIAMVIMGYLPIVMTHYAPLAIFGAANGQCMLWRRSAYDKIGGHEAVANNVLDDVSQARLVKQAGLRLRMADGNGLVTCRMYDSWPAVRDGFAKNILAGYGSAVALVLATIFHWAVFLLPYVWLFDANLRLYGLLAIGLAFGIRALSAAATHQRIRDSLLMPVSVLLMTRISVQALRWHVSGGPRWKGRVIQQQTGSAHHG
ncbi:MAG: family 2 glycosyl transferase [Anaerolineaceae bacterium]|nr:family 2 glycosyl transferase [Anaerolineaceae bacterium]